MLKLSSNLDVRIVPNGVNLDFFKVRNSFSTDKPIILFLANFKWLQNSEAAEILIKEVYPEIISRFSKARLWIVGQHIPENIINLSKQNISIKNLAEDDEQGIQDAYYEANVFVSPLRGPCGTRLKHLAAMASKLPLVTTPVGAEGLGAKNGRDVVVKRQSKDLAKATVELLKNPKMAEKLANNARKLVVEKYSWKKMAEQLSKISEETAKN